MVVALQVRYLLESMRAMRENGDDKWKQKVENPKIRRQDGMRDLSTRNETNHLRAIHSKPLSSKQQIPTSPLLMTPLP